MNPEQSLDFCMKFRDTILEIARRDETYSHSREVLIEATPWHPPEIVAQGLVMSCMALLSGLRVQEQSKDCPQDQIGDLAISIIGLTIAELVDELGEKMRRRP
jgi:hypothetical protein